MLKKSRKKTQKVFINGGLFSNGLINEEIVDEKGDRKWNE